MTAAVVVDANVIFSSLLSEESRLRKVLLTGDDAFYTTNFAIIELFKHKDKIVRSSRLTEEEVSDAFYAILERISVVREAAVAADLRLGAWNLCNDIDPKDTPHVALTLHLDGRLWTGDKQPRGARGKGVRSILRSVRWRDERAFNRNEARHKRRASFMLPGAVKFSGVNSDRDRLTPLTSGLSLLPNGTCRLAPCRPRALVLADLALPGASI